MKASPKGMAAMIVAKMPKGEKPEGGESADYDGKQACAEDMMRAIEEKDPGAFMAALDAYLEHR